MLSEWWGEPKESGDMLSLWWDAPKEGWWYDAGMVRHPERGRVSYQCGVYVIRAVVRWTGWCVSWGVVSMREVACYHCDGTTPKKGDMISVWWDNAKQRGVMSSVRMVVWYQCVGNSLEGWNAISAVGRR